MDDGVTGSSGALEDPLASISRDYRDAGGLRHFAAARTPDDGFLIEGQGLGPGVEWVFGAGLTEYEGAWAVPPDAVPRAIAALDGHEGNDPLRLLVAWSARSDLELPDRRPMPRLAEPLWGGQRLTTRQ